MVFKALAQVDTVQPFTNVVRAIEQKDVTQDKLSSLKQVLKSPYAILSVSLLRINNRLELNELSLKPHVRIENDCEICDRGF